MGSADRTAEERRDAPAGQRPSAAKVGIRDLGRNPSRILAELVATGQPVIITDRGRPVAVLTPIDEGDLEDFILTHAEAYVRAREATDAGLPLGRTHSLTDVLAELDD